jgi:hypothetical protein
VRPTHSLLPLTPHFCPLYHFSLLLLLLLSLLLLLFLTPYYSCPSSSLLTSQVLMDEELRQDVHPADSLFPLFKSQAAPSTRAVTLNPGEVLYVPPYWLVRAEFPVLSVFIDVPSLSEELVSAGLLAGLGWAGLITCSVLSVVLVAVLFDVLSIGLVACSVRPVVMPVMIPVQSSSMIV